LPTFNLGLMALPLFRTFGMRVDLQQREAGAMAGHGNQERICFPYRVRPLARGLFSGVFMYAVVVFLASAWLPAAAQNPELDEKQKEAESKLPDPKNGLIVARKLCTNCHLIGEPANASVPADVPSFPSIANRPNQSADALTNWLVAPHAPMPDPHLTRKEIRDIAGYILLLRTAE
jgi:mono/diheme cytochrome c family protein